MSKLLYPHRIFSLNDCHGGARLWDPLASPDVAARLAEAIRSDLPNGVEHIDTFGAPLEYYQYIVGEALRLHKENPDVERTGLFMNSAPRTKIGKNGEPFYRAEFDLHRGKAFRGANVCIVATPLDVFSGVRGEIKKLQALPNKENGLYGNGEQHRSSYTPRLLADNHGLQLIDVDPMTIPELAEGCRVGYIDRFGNLVISVVGTECERLQKFLKQNQGKNISVRIGMAVREVCVGSSLGASTPGSLSLYQNDGNVEILCKWSPDWSPTERLNHSAYVQFGGPVIGTLCEVK